MVEQLRVAGVDGEVTVYRDEWGIPHARAGTALDAFFAQGFVQAADRLGQLEYDRRRAYGRWAEVAGPAAAAFDVFVRRCGLGAAARREHDALDPEAQQVLAAFAAGVNAWLALERPLPPDLELAGATPDPWSAWDCCAVFLVRHVAFASWQKKLWRGRLATILGPEGVARFEGADPRAVPLIVPPDRLFESKQADPAELDAVLAAMSADGSSGSNAWALSGRRTASGLPLVAGDPHRLVEVPGVYAQVHLACDEFDAAGLSFVGVPGVPHFGCTERTAWCVTNANGDYQDLYVERFANDDPTRYRWSGGWRDATHRFETIGVRGADPIEVECWETHHGPVVFGEPGSGLAIALRSTALAEPSTGLSALLPMLRARSVAELDDVMRRWVDPVNNFVSADVDGSVAYRTVGRLPTRSRANGWGPVPGWTGEHEWEGYVAYEEMPHLVDPESGLIVTANQRIVDDEYPHYISHEYARPDRALRLHSRLDDMTGATAAEMAAVHRDRRSLAADVWVERLVTLETGDEVELRALELLRGWDRVMDPGSAAAALYVAIRDSAGKQLAHNPALEPLRAPIPDEPAATYLPLELRLWAVLTGLLARDDELLLPAGTGWDDVLTASLADGIAVLTLALGDDMDAWRWGALHVAAPRHPLSAADPEWARRLDPPSVEMGGEWDTVFSAAHAAGRGFGVTTSSVARYVFDVADRADNAWVVPLGASGDAGSPHFADQQQAWAEGELLSMRLDWDDLAAHASARVVLVPAADAD